MCFERLTENVCRHIYWRKLLCILLKFITKFRAAEYTLCILMAYQMTGQLHTMRKLINTDFEHTV